MSQISTLDALRQVSEAAKEYTDEKIGNIKTANNLEDGSGKGAVQQIPDKVADGFDFTDKNPNATELDPDLTGTIPYGATGAYASSFGGKSAAMGKRSQTEGTTTIAKGAYSHAEGDNAVALGDDSHVEGYKTTAYGESSHAEGNDTIAKGKASHAEGFSSLAEGAQSHSEGALTQAQGDSAHAEGMLTHAIGNRSHAEGSSTLALGEASHAEGETAKAAGNYSHAEGQHNSSTGKASHAEGYLNEANGNYSHTEGESNITSGQSSHAEGIQQRIKKDGAHAEGAYNFVGSNTESDETSSDEHTGRYAHAEGSYNIVRGDSAHVEGQNNIVDLGADYAHIEGTENIAKHAGAHLSGRGLISGRQNQTVIGEYNAYDDNALFIVGNGKKDEPHNALVVRPDGTIEGDFSASIKPPSIDEDKLVYDHVITTADEFMNLSAYEGKILVKYIPLPTWDLGTIYVNNNATLLDFENFTANTDYTNLTCTIIGNYNCTIKNLQLPNGYTSVTLQNFGIVENCDINGYDSGSIEKCSFVSNSSAAYIRNCQNVSNCRMSSDYDAYLINCKYVCGIYQNDGNASGTATITCDSCEFVSNVNADGTYVNCKYVDPNTCKGFVKDEDVGKVQMITNDGSFQTLDPSLLVTNENFEQTMNQAYIDIGNYVEESITNVLGDIDSLLATINEGGVAI